MAVEDLEWQERYGDQSYKLNSIIAVRVAMFSLYISQVIVLPSMFVYLGTFHSSFIMLGYCLTATCVGEFCGGGVFGLWYDRRSAREVVIGALLLSSIASIIYSLAPHRIVVLFSRFLVGFAGGVQEPLLTLVSSMTNKYSRSEVRSSLRSVYILAFIVGAGLSTSVSFVHMHNPGIPLDSMQHALPLMVKEDSNSTVNDFVNATSSIAIMGWHASMKDWMDDLSNMAGLADVSGGALGNRSKRLETSLVNRRRLQEWGTGRWFEEDAVPVLMSLLEDNSTNSSSNSSEEVQVAPAPVAVNERVEGNEKDVETDNEIAQHIGDQNYYIPGYFTAIVGHGLTAPGYIAAAFCLLSAIWVWLYLQEGPRKHLIQRVPLAHLSPKSLKYFYPLAACVALEFLAQMTLVSIESIVPPLLRVWNDWSCDAIAIFIMGNLVCGVIGIAVFDPLKKMQPLRSLIFLSVFLVLLGFSFCFPWRGRMDALSFTFGCCLSCFGFFPLSEIANDIVSAAIVKVYSEDGELVWLQLFWSMTRLPARALGPLALILAIDLDPTGVICFLLLSSLSFIALVIFFVLRHSLISPDVQEEAEVLPGAEISMREDFRFDNYWELYPNQQ